jgi:hypothetical protein
VIFTLAYPCGTVHRFRARHPTQLLAGILDHTDGTTATLAVLVEDVRLPVATLADGATPEDLDRRCEEWFRAAVLAANTYRAIRTAMETGRRKADARTGD